MLVQYVKLMYCKVLRCNSAYIYLLADLQVGLLNSCCEQEIDGLNHEAEKLSWIDGFELKMLVVQLFGVKTDQVVQMLPSFFEF